MHIMLPIAPTVDNYYLSTRKAMAMLTYLIIQGLLTVVIGNACVREESRELLWTKQLKSDLFVNCKYDLYSPPKSHTNKSEPLSVTYHFRLRYFHLDSDEGILTMQIVMFISWIDERLTWDPDKYGGVTEINRDSWKIWSPPLGLLNNVESYYFDDFMFTTCKLNNTGHINCMPVEITMTKCKIDLSDFPYDAQECSLEYGAWNTKDDFFKMNFSSRAISMLGADYGSQWFISDYRQQSERLKQLIMTFVFEREAESLAAIIIYPSLILSSLTVVCLLLDVKNNVRLGLVCFSIFSHFYWLVELGDYIPKASLNPPRLLLYYRGSMVLTLFALITTFLLSIVCNIKTLPHNVIISVNSLVQKSITRFLIFPWWNVGDKGGQDENEFNKVWINFANIINSVCIVATVIAYVAMYCVFMPHPIPFK